MNLPEQYIERLDTILGRAYKEDYVLSAEYEGDEEYVQSFDYEKARKDLLQLLEEVHQGKDLDAFS